MSSLRRVNRSGVVKIFLFTGLAAVCGGATVRTVLQGEWVLAGALFVTMWLTAAIALLHVLGVLGNPFERGRRLRERQARREARAPLAEASSDG